MSEAVRVPGKGWYAFAGAVALADVIAMAVLIGFFVLMASAVWLLYRAVKGWVALEDGKPMYS